MTTTPSTILDPVTGLPLDQYSGIIQQIPLGSQVFPFEDLNADGRMTRQPIYGDDILPTSALVVGQDTKGMARAGTMDTSRRLWTREAVFQNLGKAIPDGTTAPVDVNVVSGGGGGGSSALAYKHVERSDFVSHLANKTIGAALAMPVTLYSYLFNWRLDNTYAGGANNGSVWLYVVGEQTGATFPISIQEVDITSATDAAALRLYGSQEQFVGGWLLDSTLLAGNTTLTFRIQTFTFDGNFNALVRYTN